MPASRTQLLPPGPALAPYVQAIAVRRPSEQGPALPAVQCFPANVLGALTVLHRGDWLDADTGQPMAALELAGPRLAPARRRYANDPAITTVLLRPGVLNWLFDIPAADWVGQRRPAQQVIGSAPRGGACPAARPRRQHRRPGLVDRAAGAGLGGPRPDTRRLVTAPAGACRHLRAGLGPDGAMEHAPAAAPGR